MVRGHQRLMEPERQKVRAPVPQKVREPVPQTEQGPELQTVPGQEHQRAPEQVHQRVLREGLAHQKVQERELQRVHREPASVPQRALERDFRKPVPRKHLVVEQEHFQTTRGPERVLQTLIQREPVRGSQTLERESLNRKALLVQAQDFRTPEQCFAERTRRR